MKNSGHDEGTAIQWDIKLSIAGALEPKFNFCNFSFQGLGLPIFCLMLTIIKADSDTDYGNRQKNYVSLVSKILPFPH